MSFSEKIVLVSGAALGMGFRISQKFAADGAKVMLTDIDEKRLIENVQFIRDAGGIADYVVVDVLKHQHIQDAVSKTIEKFGGLHFLLNFAGGNPHRVLNQPGPFLTSTPELLSWGIDVNLRGALLFARFAMPEIITSGGGVIINIGSIDGVTGSGSPEYSAAKSGMDGLTKSLAKIGAYHNIRVANVIPGPVLTRAAMSSMRTLLGRAAEVDELVDFILFICSDKGGAITGSSHLVDCGRACLI